MGSEVLILIMAKQTNRTTKLMQTETCLRRLRVAFLTPSLHIGGAERWILALARNFQAVQPAGVVVCSPHHHPAMLEQAARLMPVFLARKHGDAGETRRLLERASITADVLITWGVPRLAVVTRKLVGRIGNPFGSVEDSPCEQSSSPRQRSVPHFEDEKTRTKYEDEETETYRDAKRYLPVIDVSHSEGGWTQQTKMTRRAASGADFHVAVSRGALGAFDEKIRRRATVIYNGAEVDRVAPRSTFGISDLGFGKERTALFLGRFEKVKGFDRLFDAAQHLPSNWKIFAHGHGSLQTTIRNPQSAIRIGPPLSHVGAALAAADVLVMPSRHEGMPLTMIEAWLAGTPVVATPFGFVHEATQMHGPLCDVVPQNPTGQQLAAGILRAAEGRYVTKAREVAWQHYTAAAMAQRWEEYLQCVVQAWHARGHRVNEESPLTNDEQRTVVERETACWNGGTKKPFQNTDKANRRHAPDEKRLPS